MERKSTIIDGRERWLAARERNIGASEVAALFGCHPYTSALRLWAEKRGDIRRLAVENMATRRGQIFEAAVGEALRLMHPDWKLIAGGVYHELPEYRLGATPDFIGTDAEGARFIVQAKTVTPDKWEEEWTPAPPACFLFQVQAEMMAAGYSRAVLAVMIMDGHEYAVHEYAYDADPEIQDAILARAAQFWQAVADGREPKLDAKHDGSTLAAIYSRPQAETPLLLHGNDAAEAACAEHIALGKQIKALQEQRDAAGMRVASLLRNHSKAEAGAYRVSWPAVEATSYMVERKAHRRLTIRKAKG